jgi:L-alanine-DL-glutamate epimerase-like enolase superfamily enzyme
VKIERVSVDLKLKEAFQTSRNVVSVSRSYFLKADDAVGEASPVRFYGETPAIIEAACERLVAELTDWSDPRDLWPQIDSALGYNFAAKCGLDLLFWDHLGKQENASVGQLLGIRADSPASTAYSIGIGSPEQMQAQVQQRRDFKVYKLKVGFDADVDAVRAVREVTDAPIYVDANGGWSVEDACARLPELEKLGVVLCEQPIFSADKRDWERVRASSSLPVIVDEYCQRPQDVALWAGWVDGVNVKLQKCGGITPVFEMISRARDCGLKVMIGCMIESSVSIAAAAQLAPLADYVDLDSHMYLAADPYDGIPCTRGQLIPSGKPGLGVWERQKVTT